MKAPSEKHLEDWIVTNRLEMFGGDANVLGRQFQLPSGIADLVFHHRSNTFNVVELKKDPISAKSVAQVLRYMGDIQGIYKGVLAAMLSRKSLDRYEYDYAMQSIHLTINGVLIGHGYSDKHLPLICEAASIYLLTYEYDPIIGYRFNCIANPHQRSGERSYDAYHTPALILAMKEIALGTADAYTNERT